VVNENVADAERISAIRDQEARKRKRITQRTQRAQSSQRRGRQEKVGKKITPRPGRGKRRRGERRGHAEEERKKQIPPLRGPTRHNSARKRKSGRFDRDDKLE
jgi:hypothetical protein